VQLIEFVFMPVKFVDHSTAVKETIYAKSLSQKSSNQGAFAMNFVDSEI
jgi:hypothetical protein